MIYKLISDRQGYGALAAVLLNRGIEEKELIHYLNPSLEDLNDWSKLGKEEMQKACSLLKKTIEDQEDILVVVDCDCDGYTSSAILLNYIYDLDEDFFINHINFFMHDGKQHGLSDVDVADNIKLVICPDAASNDYSQHQELSDRGISVLVLDHHEADYISDDAIIINNQLSDYSNKAFSGAGITWQFCRAYDELYSYDLADNYIDLAALGNCGDMMDYRSIETKFVIDSGFKHISNPFFFTMCQKNEFSINKKGGINYESIAWYVVPYINAVVRSGTQEEKDLLFRSMLKAYAFNKIPSTKRGEKGMEEYLVTQAVRMTTAVKKRQTDLQNHAMENLERQIDERDLLKNAVLIFLCKPGEVEKNIAGLVANKFQAKYQKPCLVLIKKDDGTYAGSARNFGGSPIEDFRQDCLNSNLVKMAQGQ